jgi:hypothetical protein
VSSSQSLEWRPSIRPQILQTSLVSFLSTVAALSSVVVSTSYSNVQYKAMKALDFPCDIYSTLLGFSVVAVNAVSAEPLPYVETSQFRPSLWYSEKLAVVSANAHTISSAFPCASNFVILLTSLFIFLTALTVNKILNPLTANVKRKMKINELFIKYFRSLITSFRRPIKILLLILVSSA